MGAGGCAKSCAPFPPPLDKLISICCPKMETSSQMCLESSRTACESSDFSQITCCPVLDLARHAPLPTGHPAARRDELSSGHRAEARGRVGENSPSAPGGGAATIVSPEDGTREPGSMLSQDKGNPAPWPRLGNPCSGEKARRDQALFNLPIWPQRSPQAGASLARHRTVSR